MAEREEGATGDAAWQPDGELMGAMGLPELAPQRSEKQYAPIAVVVTRPLTREEFRELALRQVLGTADVDVRWSGLRDLYAPADSPVPVRFEEKLLLRARGQANLARGIDSDEQGHVRGAGERAQQFHARPDSEEKSEIFAEIDRRYRAVIGPQDFAASTRQAALWRQIRDEVLFQQQHLATLSEPIQRALRAALGDREIAPAEYDQLFRIAQKLALLPPGGAADFAAKIGSDAADLSSLDAEVDGYFAERAEAEQEEGERTAVHDKLLGLEEVYRLYIRYQNNATEEQASWLARPAARLSKRLGLGGTTADELRPELERALARHGFASIAAFGAHVVRLEQTFEAGAVRITLDVLARYAGQLHQEAQRYRDPSVVATLHQRLGGFRGHYQDFQANARLASARSQQRTPIDSPASANPSGPMGRALAAKDAAASSVHELAAEYPILAEDALPADQRVDKTRLAEASEAELAPLLQSHLAARLAAIAEAHGQLEGNPALVYKLNQLMPVFYAQMDIQPGSVHQQIIQDKMRTDAMTKLLAGLVVAVVTAALSAVSMGAATPALMAAGATIAATGLSAQLAYAEYQDYAATSSLADAGLAEDPSVAWLALAIVSAGVDAAAATSAIRALASAARAFSAGGPVDDFTRAVHALQASQQLDERIAAAAQRAAAARAAYSSAKQGLTTALAKAYAFPGPLTEPAVFRSLLQMAVAKVAEGSHSLSAFVDDLKQARLAAKLAELSPEELVAAKDAWTRAQTLAPLLADPSHLAPLLAKIPDAAALQRLLRVFPSGELVSIAAVLDEPAKIVVMFDHFGEAYSSQIVRRWFDGKKKIEKANNFLKHFTASLEQREMGAGLLHSHSTIVDTNIAISMNKERVPALRSEMSPLEQSTAQHMKSISPDEQLHLTDISMGETGNPLHLGQVSIEAQRSSPAYLSILEELERANVGGKKGAADRLLVADALMSQREPGVLAKLMTSDKDLVRQLARIARINPDKLGGFDKLFALYKSSGFKVTIGERALLVMPVQ